MIGLTENRFFSKAQHINVTLSFDNHNIGLKATTMELLECLKSWFRIGIFTEQDLHAIIDTMNEGAMEAMKDLEESLDQ